MQSEVSQVNPHQQRQFKELKQEQRMCLFKEELEATVSGAASCRYDVTESSACEGMKLWGGIWQVDIESKEVNCKCKLPQGLV